MDGQFGPLNYKYTEFHIIRYIQFHVVFGIDVCVFAISLIEIVVFLLLQNDQKTKPKLETLTAFQRI